MNTGLMMLKKEQRVIAAAAGLTAAAVFPWLIHLAGVPGAVWLPLYTAPLLCGVFFPAPAVWLAALSGPLFSRLASGMPSPQLSAALTVETVILGGVLLFLRRRSAGVLFFPAAVVAARVGGIVPALVIPGLSVDGWFQLLSQGLPGLALHALSAAVLMTVCRRNGSCAGA